MTTLAVSNNFENNPKSISKFDEKNYNLLKTCRLCLNEVNDLVSLFDKNTTDGRELLYSEMATECASIKIDKEDKLPKIICFECVQHLNNSYNFRKLCENSERVLHNFLKNNYESDKVIKAECPIDIEESFLIPKNEPTSPQFYSDNFLNQTEDNSDEDIKYIKTEPYTIDINNTIESTSASNSTESLGKYLNNLTGNTSKNLSSISALEMHLTKQVGEKYFICDECGKVFSDEFTLKDHKRIHLVERPYKCDYCGKFFAFLPHLKSHQQNIHLDKKRYKCKDCEKAFNYSSHLKRHELIHKDMDGEKPYVCKECNKGFFRIDYLRVHRQTHTAKKNYKCNKCKKSYSTSTYLKLHEKTRRSNEKRTNVLKDHQRTYTGT